LVCASMRRRPHSTSTDASHRHGCARSHCTRGLKLALPHRHAELGGLGMLHRFLAVDAITIPKAWDKATFIRAP
jgi:hypothetical protein